MTNSELATATVKSAQVFFTVEQFAGIEPAFTQAALRSLIFKAAPRQTSLGEISGNGALEAGAIIRHGRKVLIDRERFLSWYRAASAPAPAPAYVDKRGPGRPRGSRSPRKGA